MYIRKFPDNAASYMDKVKPDKWGLSNSIKQLKSEATQELKIYEGTAQEWWNNNKTVIDGNEYLQIKDYNGRTWTMTKQGFDVHTSNIYKKREYRTQYLDAIKDIMQNPDEVWISRTINDIANNKKTLNYYTMIKYFKGEAMGVYCQITPEKLVFNTWFPIKDKGVRSGLLIKKK